MQLVLSNTAYTIKKEVIELNSSSQYFLIDWNYSG